MQRFDGFRDNPIPINGANAAPGEDVGIIEAFEVDGDMLRLVCALHDGLGFSIRRTLYLRRVCIDSITIYSTMHTQMLITTTRPHMYRANFGQLDNVELAVRSAMNGTDRAFSASSKKYREKRPKPEENE